MKIETKPKLSRNLC